MLVFKLKCVCRKKQKTKCFLGTLWTHFHPPHLILALSLPSGLGFLLLNFLFSLYVSLHQNTLIATIIFLLPHLHLAPYFPFISSLSLTLLFSLCHANQRSAGTVSQGCPCPRSGLLMPGLLSGTDSSVPAGDHQTFSASDHRPPCRLGLMCILSLFPFTAVHYKKCDTERKTGRRK